MFKLPCKFEKSVATVALCSLQHVSFFEVLCDGEGAGTLWNALMSHSVVAAVVSFCEFMADHASFSCSAREALYGFLQSVWVFVCVCVCVCVAVALSCVVLPGRFRRAKPSCHGTRVCDFQGSTCISNFKLLSRCASELCEFALQELKRLHAFWPCSLHQCNLETRDVCLDEEDKRIVNSVLSLCRLLRMGSYFTRNILCIRPVVDLRLDVRRTSASVLLSWSL
jgi:hypothetical protein